MEAMNVPARIGLQNLWMWFPKKDAQSLQALSQGGISVVEGELECEKCPHREVQSLNLLETFNNVRNQLVAWRARVLDNFFSELPFGGETHKRSRCPACRKKSLRPVIPVIDKIPRDLGQTNILFLFLGGYVRFLDAKSLRGILLQYGFPRRRIYSIDLPSEPKQSYVVAAQYVLAQVLEPENQDLALGSWPLHEIWNP